MPAYFDTGFSVRKPMWHGLGRVTDDYPETWDQAREWAGLEWEPMTETFYQKRVTLSDGGEFVEAYEPVQGHRLVVRSDTSAPLATVSENFELVSHSTMGEIIEAVLEAEPGRVKFETAGSVRDGRQVWALAYLDEPTEIAGDDSATYPFLALLNSHDGTGACKVIATSVRVVCWNTYRAAEMEGERSGRQFVFHHRRGVMERIDEAKAALRGVREDATRWRELAEYLASVRADDAKVREFLDLFLPMPTGEAFSDRVKANAAADRATFLHLYEASPTTDGHRGTVLGVLDASVEYLDHLRGYRNRDTYMGRTLLRPEPLKAKALTIAREVFDLAGAAN